MDKKKILRAATYLFSGKELSVCEFLHVTRCSIDFDENIHSLYSLLIAMA